MTLLTESERVSALYWLEKGLSYGETAHKILEKRAFGLQVALAKEIRTLTGDKLARQLKATETLSL